MWSFRSPVSRQACYKIWSHTHTARYGSRRTRVGACTNKDVHFILNACKPCTMSPCNQNNELNRKMCSWTLPLKTKTWSKSRNKKGKRKNLWTKYIIHIFIFIRFKYRFFFVIIYFYSLIYLQLLFFIYFFFVRSLFAGRKNKSFPVPTCKCWMLLVTLRPDSYGAITIGSARRKPANS